MDLTTEPKTAKQWWEEFEKDMENILYLPQETSMLYESYKIKEEE